MEDLFLKIKRELLQQGRSEYVASVMASHICLNCHELIKDDKEIATKVCDILRKELN